MLSSSRMTPTRADESEDDTELWESLRVEADRRSSEYPARGRSVPPPMPTSGGQRFGYATQQGSPFTTTYTGGQGRDEFHEYFELEPELASAAQQGYTAVALPQPIRAPESMRAPSPSIPPAFDAQAWARTFEAPATESIDAATPRARSRWLVPVVVLASLLGVGAAGYQFVLLPKQEQERAAALAALAAQQARVDEERRDLEEAEALAAEEARKTAEATARADEAAAAAERNAQGGPKATLGKADQDDRASEVRGRESRAERRARARVERHERRAAARARRHQARAERDSARSESSRSRSSSRSGSRSRAESGENSDDPLLGL